MKNDNIKIELIKHIIQNIAYTDEEKIHKVNLVLQMALK